MWTSALKSWLEHYVDPTGRSEFLKPLSPQGIPKHCPELRVIGESCLLPEVRSYNVHLTFYINVIKCLCESQGSVPFQRPWIRGCIILRARLESQLLVPGQQADRALSGKGLRPSKEGTIYIILRLRFNGYVGYEHLKVSKTF